MQASRIGRWSRRAALALLLLVLLAALGVWLFLRASLAQLDGTRRVDGLDGAVSIARDALGVPQISGASRNDVAYATGFVHAQERYFQMDLLRRLAAGELAELFGERAVEADKIHRLHRFRARAEAALAALPAEDKLLLWRYVDGVNAGLQGLAARPFEYALTGAAPRPWAMADSLLVIWAMYFDLQGAQEGRELARGWLAQNSDAAQRDFLTPRGSQWDVPLDAAAVSPELESAAVPARAPAWWGKPLPAPAPGAVGGARLAQAAAPTLAAVDLVDAVGSNNWALAGSRTRDGGAIVAADMHLGIQLPNIWYRAALRFPDAQGQARRVVGVTLPGTPVVVVGSNGHVAWGYTNSYADHLDLIALETDPARPGQLRTRRGWETPRTLRETILVKGAAALTFEVRETSLGPLREALGHTYAIQWSAHAPQAASLNARRMELVDTLQQALALAPTLGIPAQNFVAGDAQGNIGWTIAGPLPRRAGDAERASFPLALDDPAGVWTGWLTPAEYPRVVNPAGGQVYTANSRQLAGAGAALLGDGGYDLGARTRQVRDDLAALGPRADAAGVYAVGLDDRALFIAAWRERAVAALDAGAVAGRPQRAEALRLLNSSWSGRASVDSVGYRIAHDYLFELYEIVFESANVELARLGPKATMWQASRRWPALLARLLDERPAGWLPPAYTSWQQLQLAALDRVIVRLGRDGRPLAEASWGERNRASSAHPFSSLLPPALRWLAVPPDMLAGDSNMPRVAGPAFGQSERLTVAPGREEQGLFAMPGGQSGHPLSPYFLAGHADWVAGGALPLLPGAAVHTLSLTR
ncbi:penicillin acylase family protein [Rugamonas sp. CCM 8940]|uniref:penicillin acylase family protein n=1 Tax=Rugamonas sp. CCM 8940 TaxID=2765359 RepID=UPI0018F42ED7|nr:penicillin acylase family protein [Rugamonas sp. CCM 8940]MBJ7312669.1 penicillin acylase family protein [Rugamonas sp. CCM 8940]